MNLHNKEYYSYGFLDDEATIDYEDDKMFITHMGRVLRNIIIKKAQDNNSGGTGNNGNGQSGDSAITEIDDFSFNKENGELTLNYKTSDGQENKLVANIDANVISGIDDIQSLILDKEDKLILTYTKQGTSKTVDVDLSKLEDDINWRRLNK